MTTKKLNPETRNQPSSRLKGFYKRPRGERLDLIGAFSDLPVDQLRLLGQDGSLPFETTDLFIENAVGARADEVELVAHQLVMEQKAEINNPRGF